MEKRGLDLGDQVTAEISGYQEDEMAVVLLTVPLCTVKLEIAGYATWLRRMCCVRSVKPDGGLMMGAWNTCHPGCALR